MAKKIRVFVYGTLKSGQPNHVVLSEAEFLGRATITGAFNFVDLGWYPAVVKLDADGVRQCIGGEVYEINSDVLETLDMIEGHPNYYCRDKVFTSLGFKAWTYMLPDAYKERTPVPTLFWRENDEDKAWLKGLEGNTNESAAAGAA